MTAFVRALGALIAIAFACAALGQEPLRIGFLTVRTGPLAAGGRQMEEGINLFLKERNNTLAGRKVQIFFGDTAGQPAQAKSKAQELVEREKVHILVGPLATFEALAQTGSITSVVQTPAPYDTSAQDRLASASPQHLQEANRRYEILRPHLAGARIAGGLVPARTVYDWLRKYRMAEALYGNGFLGLLPRTHASGNRTRKLPARTRTLMDDFIANAYETVKQPSRVHVYGALVHACEAQGTPTPSYKTFTQEIARRPQYQQTLSRKGPRAAYQHEPCYLALEGHTPRHGDRPWHICHIESDERPRAKLKWRCRAMISPNHGCRWSTRRRTAGECGCCTPPIFSCCVATPPAGSNARPSPISSAWLHGALLGSSTQAMAAGTVPPESSTPASSGCGTSSAHLGTSTRCTGVIWSSWKTICVAVPQLSQTVRDRPSSRWYAPTRVSRLLPCSVSRSRVERTTSTV